MISREKARELKLVPLTKWLKREEEVETRRGWMNAINWLRREKKRIEKDHNRVARIVKNKDGKIALFVN